MLAYFGGRWRLCALLLKKGTSGRVGWRSLGDVTKEESGALRPGAQPSGRGAGEPGEPCGGPRGVSLRPPTTGSHRLPAAHRGVMDFSWSSTVSKDDPSGWEWGERGRGSLGPCCPPHSPPAPPPGP